MWESLGIQPTTDRAEIRRAYASQLRLIDVDHDPQAFQELRGAYERAITYALHSRQPAAERADAGIVPPPHEVAPHPVALTDTALAVVEPPRDPDIDQAAKERRRVLKSINDALAARTLPVAITHYERGLARGLFPIGQRETVVEKIDKAAMDDPGLSSRKLTALIARFGWDHLPGRGEAWSAIRHQAMERAEAEKWYQHLVDVARGKAEWTDERRVTGNSFQYWAFRRKEAKNAQLMLGGRRFLIPTADAAESLRVMYRQYLHYRPWLANRLPDPGERVDKARLRSETLGWLRPWRILGFIFACLLLLPVLLAGGAAAIWLVVGVFWLIRMFGARR